MFDRATNDRSVRVAAVPPRFVTGAKKKTYPIEISGPKIPNPQLIGG